MKSKLILLALTAGLMSCEKNDEQEEAKVQTYQFRSIPLADLPQAINYHLQSSFPNSSIRSAEKDPDFGYEVEISSGWELYYDLNANFLYKESNQGDDDDIPVPISSLPAAIANYISANYPGESIMWAEWDDDEYEVYLSNGRELYFDRNGYFLYAEQDDVPVDPSALPQNILDYVAQNYPNATIVSAERDDQYYELELSNGFELYFDLNGNFLGVDIDDQSVDPANLPQPILDYVQQNYPNQTIVEAEIDDNMYELELSNEVELYFDLQGNFLYADFD